MPVAVETSGASASPPAPSRIAQSPSGPGWSWSPHHRCRGRCCWRRECAVRPARAAASVRRAGVPQPAAAAGRTSQVRVPAMTEPGAGAGQRAEGHGLDSRRRVLDGRRRIRPTWTKSACRPPRTRRPIHRVYVDGFWMDATDVTNDDFAAFVKATGYVTVGRTQAARRGFAEALRPRHIVAGSVEFAPTDRPVPLDDHMQWWAYDEGHELAAPAGRGERHQGQGRIIRSCMCAYEDAVAYANWAGKRLADRSGVGVRPSREAA